MIQFCGLDGVAHHTNTSVMILNTRLAINGSHLFKSFFLKNYFTNILEKERLILKSFLKEKVSSILGQLYKKMEKLMIMLHMNILEQDGWNGGSYPVSCVIRMCHLDLNVSSIKWLLDRHNYVVWGRVLAGQELVHPKDVSN